MLKLIYNLATTVHYGIRLSNRFWVILVTVENCYLSVYNTQRIFSVKNNFSNGLCTLQNGHSCVVFDSILIESDCIVIVESIKKPSKLLLIGIVLILSLILLGFFHL